MRLAWATDLHFDHASEQAFDAFVSEVQQASASALMITGDIAEAMDVADRLAQLADRLSIPILFVLGNHDFYRGQIATVREAMIHLCASHENLHFMTASDPILFDGIAVVGDDGWGDAREGDYIGSTIRLNDFELIDDFRNTPRTHWEAILNKLGDESAGRLRSRLNEVVGIHRHCIVLTHVPPMREACWYEGHTTDDNWAPFFVCRAVGDCLKDVANNNPDTRFLVLCGHTHNGGTAAISDNLHILTAAAEYKAPHLAGIFDTETLGMTWPPIMKTEAPT